MILKMATEVYERPHTYKVKSTLYSAKQRLFGASGMGELWVTAKRYTLLESQCLLRPSEGGTRCPEGCEGILVTAVGWPWTRSLYVPLAL